MIRQSHAVGPVDEPLLEITIGHALEKAAGQWADRLALVSLHQGIREDVIAHCKGRIAHYKVPRHVRVVESFVMTVTGKAQKFEMRKIMEAELGCG